MCIDSCASLEESQLHSNKISLPFQERCLHYFWWNEVYFSRDQCPTSLTNGPVCGFKKRSGNPDLSCLSLSATQTHPNEPYMPFVLEWCTDWQNAGSPGLESATAGLRNPSQGSCFTWDVTKLLSLKVLATVPDEKTKAFGALVVFSKLTEWWEVEPGIKFSPLTPKPFLLA